MQPLSDGVLNSQQEAPLLQVENTIFLELSRGLAHLKFPLNTLKVKIYHILIMNVALKLS